MRTKITIDGADYIAWAPVHSTIRLVEADEGADFVEVLLKNQDPDSRGGQVVFRGAWAERGHDSLRLRLPADGTPVDFFVAGKFGRPSKEDKDAVIEAVEANTGAVLSTKDLMVLIRKNANDLTEGERDRFLSAFAELNTRGLGRFRDFRDMHTNASDPQAHRRAGFLPWHRAYLLDLERELQQIDPSVALPYWRFDKSAPNLFTREFMGVPNGDGIVQFVSGHPLEFWETDGGVVIDRTPLFTTATSPASPPPTVHPDLYPLKNEAATMLLGNLYADFWDMETNPHGSAHLSFTGSIQAIHTAARDPLFFLLHANVDRLWAKWQVLYQRFDAAEAATYPPQGIPEVTDRIGHRLEDTMWPWNGVMGGERPPTAPGGDFADSPTTNAPEDEPKVRDMIDYQGVINPGKRLGFGYDDVGLDNVVP